MMLKEMQVLVAKERLAREELQNKIEYLETSLTEKEALKKSDDEWTVILGGNLKMFVIFLAVH